MCAYKPKILAIADGGTGSSTAQAAIIALGAAPASLNYQVVAIDNFFGSSTAFQLGWNVSSANSGTAGGGTSSAGHYGVGIISTGSASSSGAESIRNGPLSICPGTDAMSFFFEMQLPILSTSGERYTIDFGVSDIVTVTDAIANAVYLSYNDNVNGGQWVGNSIKATTPSSTNTTTAADTNYHIWEIRLNASWTNATFYQDGVQIGSAITTNIPNTSSNIVAPYIRITKSVGTGARTVNIDTYKTSIVYTTPHSGG